MLVSQPIAKDVAQALERGCYSPICPRCEELLHTRTNQERYEFGLVIGKVPEAMLSDSALASLTESVAHIHSPFSTPIRPRMREDSFLDYILPPAQE